ncbi:hypothetical protein ACJRO7_008404 [Eucalyptus globulus]|uniref:Uncharacterized protein n=1 Tax=Eucalyptus globulus TaxID=34317 RepID=A0ABD3IRZ5_EUCGL
MMANQSGNNNHRQRAGRSRRTFLFVNGENISIPDSGSLLLGRKVNLGFMAGGLVPYYEEHSYRDDNDIAGESERIEKLIGEAREGLIREESIGFPKLIVEVTSNGRVRDGGAVTYEGNVFMDENEVSPNVCGVYAMKSWPKRDDDSLQKQQNLEMIFVISRCQI